MAMRSMKKEMGVRRAFWMILCILLLAGCAGCTKKEGVEKKDVTTGSTGSKGNVPALEKSAKDEAPARADSNKSDAFISKKPDKSDIFVSNETDESVAFVSNESDKSVASVSKESEKEDTGVPEGSNKEEREERETMRLFFGDVEVPVLWENNQTVRELRQEVDKGEITIQMTMYGGCEQVGALGKKYTRNDKNMTAQSGDILLYRGDQIVVFYGPNSWSYTRLGRMEISPKEVKKLLAEGDIILKIKK